VVDPTPCRRHQSFGIGAKDPIGLGVRNCSSRETIERRLLALLAMSITAGGGEDGRNWPDIVKA
jgi:hypothetical protein